MASATPERTRHWQWTVALVPEPHEKVICTNRFIELIPFDSFDLVYAHMPKRVQTVITVLSETDSRQFTEKAIIKEHGDL